MSGFRGAAAKRGQAASIIVSCGAVELISVEKAGT